MTRVQKLENELFWWRANYDGKLPRWALFLWGVAVGGAAMGAAWLRS